MKKILLSLAFLSSMILFGQSDNALHFDGADDYVSTTKSAITGNGARSFEAWIRTDANCIPGSGGVQRVIADMGGFTTGGRFTFNLLWANSLRVEIGGSGVSGTVAVNDSNWHHVAATYDPTAVKKVNLFVDGVSCGSGNFTSTPSTSSGNVVIGRRLDGANPFDGDIDEFRLWNIALTPTQIQNHMNGEICAPSSNLVLYYKMDEGTANGSNTNVTTVSDAVGTNNGTLNNFGLSGNSSNWTNGKLLSQTVYDTVAVSSCGGFPIPDGSGFWTSSGVYDWTFAQTTGPGAGCDSIVNFNLTVDTVDSRTAQNGIVLSALAATGSFQWVNCADSSIITGETNSVFVPTANGQYAVIVTQGNCTEISNCMTVTTIGIGEHHHDVLVYPNPNVGIIYFTGISEFTFVEIWNLSGQKLYESKIENEHIQLPSDFPNGTYLIQIEGISSPEMIVLSR